jgi:hypothetical protein
VHPVELGSGISFVSDNKSLLYRHLHALVIEVELQSLLRESQADWIGRGSYQEGERPVVDQVCDWDVEILRFGRAEHNIEASFLTRRDALRGRARLTQFRVLVE